MLPVLSTLRRNKVGASLIAGQIALSMAILCNALFIIQQHLAFAGMPSGVDEANIFTLQNNWIGNADTLDRTPEALATRIRADLATLRSMPGVVDAFESNGFPLRGYGPGIAVSHVPNDKTLGNGGAVYVADDHAIHTLGLNLIAGRNFTASEIQLPRANEPPAPPVIIVSRTLAEQMFPHESALGKTLYLAGGARPSSIIGIVERLASPWSSGISAQPSYIGNSVLAPYLNAASGYPLIVRVQPGKLDDLIKAAPKKLNELDHGRELDSITPFWQTRLDFYANDRAQSIVFGVVSGILLAVTAFGIVGLTSFWVTQRRRQIGVRRALGATRMDILLFFLSENLLITASGAAVGVGLALALNLWMVGYFQMARLNIMFAIIGAAIVLLLGQAAALWPALRAASLPPALATRNG